MLFTRDPPQNKRHTHTQTKSKGMEKNILCKWKWKKKAGIAILISDKKDFKTKIIVRDKEGHYIIVNE